MNKEKIAKVRITPVKSTYCNIEPFEREGKLTSKRFGKEIIYYIAGESYPAEIVTILEEREAS